MAARAKKSTATPLNLKSLRFELERPAPGFYRADIEFHGVDHSGASLEARVFVDNADANALTAMEPGQAYVDSFYIFGHGGCFGHDGPCEVPARPRRPNHLRPQHPPTPMAVRVAATATLRAPAERPDGARLTVTVVPGIR